MATSLVAGVLSPAGIAVVSILIVFNLLRLLVTAIYASRFPRWTALLDAFTLLRLGGPIREHVPLKVSVDDDNVRALDELPGWVGSEPRGENSGGIIRVLAD